MGICLGCILAETFCCVCGGALKCCCCIIPCKTSVTTRLYFSLGFIVSTFLAWVLSRWGNLFPFVSNSLNDSCDKTCWNYIAVDRISFAFVLYHAFLLLATLGLKNTKDFRAPIHNAFWPIKLILWVSLIIASFYMPITAFSNYWIASFFFSAIFIIIQSMLLVDFAWTWAQEWVYRMENEESGTVYQVLLLAVTFLSYCGVIGFSVILYIYYTAISGCGLNIFFITFNLILVIAMNVISILPNVQEANPKSGIFQSAILSLYSTYVIASALNSQPASCNSLSVGNSDDAWSRFIMFVGIFFTIVALSYSALNAGSSSDQLFGHKPDDQEDESEKTKYNYSWFHFVFIIAMMYVTAVLTNWNVSNRIQESQTFQIDSGESSMWIKVVTSWISDLLYIWTLIAPILLPDRDFGN